MLNVIVQDHGEVTGGEHFQQSTDLVNGIVNVFNRIRNSGTL